MLNRFFLLLLILFSLPFILTAQTKVLEYKLNDQNLIYKNINVAYHENKILVTAAYKTGTTKILLENETQKEIFNQEITPENNNTDKQNYLSKDDLENYYLQYFGGCSKSNFWVECTYSPIIRTIYFLETNLANRVSRTSETIALKDEESIIAAFPDNNKLFIFTCVDGSEQINIYVKEPGQKLRGFEKTIELSPSKDGRRNKGKKISDFFSTAKDRDFFVFENNNFYPAALSGSKAKVYHMQQEVIFSIENSHFDTYLITLDLNNFSHSIKMFPLIPHDLEPQNPEEDYSFSFLKDSILFKTGLYQHVFSFVATNVKTREILYRTIIPVKEKDSLARWPFFKNTFHFPEQEGGITAEKAVGGTPVTVAIAPINDSLYMLDMSWYYNRVSVGKGNLFATIWANVASDKAYPVNGTTYFYYNGEVTFSSKQHYYKVENILNTHTHSIEHEVPVQQTIKQWTKRIDEATRFRNKHAVHFEKPAMEVVNNSIYISYFDKEITSFFIYKF